MICIFILFASFVFQYSAVASGAKEAIGVVLALAITAYVVRVLLGPYCCKSKRLKTSDGGSAPQPAISLRSSAVQPHQPSLGSIQVP
jgi:hypothetical protein